MKRYETSLFSKIYTTYDLLLHGHSGFTWNIPMSLEFGVLQASQKLSSIPWSPSLGWLGDSSWWFQPRKVLSKSQNGHLAPSEIHKKIGNHHLTHSLAAFSACLFLLLHVLWVKVLLILTASFIRYPNGGCFFFVCRTCHGSPISHKSSQLDGPRDCIKIWYLWNGFREGSFGCAIFFRMLWKGFLLLYTLQHTNRQWKMYPSFFWVFKRKNR